uniref:Uncharacterized protein n=2 Tax=Ciona savignyi TaxID=51511 RepID=H2ZGR6_CIOSA
MNKTFLLILLLGLLLVVNEGESWWTSRRRRRRDYLQPYNMAIETIEDKMNFASAMNDEQALNED